MANITLKVQIDDLEDSQLDGFASTFETWLRSAYKVVDAPAGHVDFVDEDDREEDDEEEGD